MAAKFEIFSSKDEFPSRMHECLQMGYNDCFYEDFYRWVVWKICPQEDAWKIPVSKWSNQGDALVSHLKKPLNFENSNS